MFGFEEDGEPTQADVGRFIPQGKLEQWWKEMAKKYPQVWGNDPCPKQHAAGTKLVSYFDDDPNKPQRVEVMGSKFDHEFPSGQYAFYVVRFKDSTELSKVHLTAAHEEDWKVGWDAPPSSST